MKEIVISIDDKTYNKIKMVVDMGLGTDTDCIIANGKILEPHGNLIDVNEFNMVTLPTSNDEQFVVGVTYMMDKINEAPIVLESYHYEE